MNTPKTALISVTDKSELESLARALTSKGVEIISTGGTAKKLSGMGVPFIPIEEITGNPEAFDGRMKTISFQIGSGILFKRDEQSHVSQARELGVRPIDLVVCNLYQFEKAAESNASADELIEQIDIGGPSMIRAAAKNYKSVTTLTSPDQYDSYIQELEKGSVSEAYNKNLAIEAFRLCYRYDEFIFKTLSGEPEEKKLRYGENPHQSAKLLKLDNTNNQSIMDAKIHQGKELSYNNILDLDAAWKACYDAFYSVSPETSASPRHCVSIIKHLNPAGLALCSDKTRALELAWAGDPISAFGSVISFSCEVESEQANWLSDKFVEIVVAPAFSKRALEVFSKKRNLRVVQLAPKSKSTVEKVYRSVSGAMLIQEEDDFLDQEFQSVTKKEFENDKLLLASFGSSVCKHLKSNAICLVSETEDGSFWLTGAGMGQPNRLDALRQLTIPRFNQKAGVSIADSILISDAFFPFRDSVDTADEFGIKWIVQPGGSIKDKEVIEACDENGIAMAFTGKRHFRH